MNGKEVAMSGKFGALLKRSNKQLREDRGLVIVKKTEKLYRRRIEDLRDELEALETDRENLMDINPGNTQTIVNPSDFDSEAFVQKDIAMKLKIRETKIKLEEAEAAYNDLFAEQAADA